MRVFDKYRAALLLAGVMTMTGCAALEAPDLQKGLITSYTQLAAATRHRTANPWVKWGESGPTSKLAQGLCGCLAASIRVSLSGVSTACALLLAPVCLAERAWSKLKGSPRRGDKGGESNISVNGPRGSLTAIFVLTFRALGARAGFNPDTVAPRLAGRVADTITLLYVTGLELPDCWGARLLTRAYVTALLATWRLTRRWIDPFTWGGLGTGASEVLRHHARTCFFDDVWASFCARHQRDRCLCVLGAGYDTRCYRQQQKHATLWEVDAPSSQRQKRQLLSTCLSETEARIAQSVRYVECDFSRESWRDKLLQNGWADSTTCFIWEGVSYYLELQQVRENLRQVARCASGSVVVFDYFLPPSSIVLQQAFEKRAKRLGEPVRSFATQEDMEALVRQAGLRVAEHIRLDSAAKRYTAPAEFNHESFDRVGFLVAEVP